LFSIHNKEHLRDTVRRSGYSKVVDKIQIFLTEDGQILLLKHLYSSILEYRVHELNLPMPEIIQYVMQHIVNRRYASASRFITLLKCIKDDSIGRFIVVECKASKPVDLVSLHVDGNISCTNSYYANYGMFGNHILACLQLKDVQLNIL